MHMSDMDVEELHTLEEDLLRPGVRRSRERLGDLIADDFVEFGASGRVFDKHDVLDAADGLPNVKLPLSDVRVKAMTSSVALVTYRSVTVAADGREAHALRSSLWARSDDGHWRIVFHQGTPVA